MGNHDSYSDCLGQRLSEELQRECEWNHQEVAGKRDGDPEGNRLAACEEHHDDHADDADHDERVVMAVDPHQRAHAPEEDDAREARGRDVSVGAPRDLEERCE